MATLLWPNLPLPLPAYGRLLFAVTDWRLMSRLDTLFGALGCSVETPADSTLCVAIERQALSELVHILSEELAYEEYAAVRVGLAPERESPVAVDPLTLPDFVARLESEWLVRLLHEGKFVTFFQPVVEMKS